MPNQYVVFTPEQFRALDDKLTEISQGGGASVDLTGYLKSADAKATYAPKSHMHAIADVTGLQTALDGKADKATTLAGYGIGNAYTKNETDTAITTALTWDEM